MQEHAVMVNFEYEATNLDPLFELEDQLEAILTSTGTGEYDGNEVAVDGSSGTLYMYGPDANLLFAAVRNALRDSTAIKNAVAKLRYGPPQDGIPEKSIAIDA
jgi:hypothetical protein